MCIRDRHGPGRVEDRLDHRHDVEGVGRGRRVEQFQRGEAVAEMKADGMEYEERMDALNEVLWPQPLAELLGAAYEI